MSNKPATPHYIKISSNYTSAVLTDDDSDNYIASSIRASRKLNEVKIDKNVAVSHIKDTATGSITVPVYVDTDGSSKSCYDKDSGNKLDINISGNADTATNAYEDEKNNNIYTSYLRINGANTKDNINSMTGTIRVKNTLVPYIAHLTKDENYVDSVAVQEYNSDKRVTTIQSRKNTSENILLLGVNGYSDDEQAGGIKITRGNTSTTSDSYTFTLATSPDKSDNSNSIATTAFVRNVIPKNVGRSDLPVYVSSDGVVTACDYNLTVKATDAIHSDYTTAFETPRAIDGVILSGEKDIHHYGECSTAKDVEIKIVDIDDFKLVTGAHAYIKFLNGNSAANPSLNINNTGNVTITISGTGLKATDIKENLIYDIIYTGTSYEICNVEYVEKRIDNVLDRKYTYIELLNTLTTGTEIDSAVYTVGANNLVVYVNGVLQVLGQSYDEVGDTGTESNKIKFLEDVSASYQIYTMSDVGYVIAEGYNQTTYIKAEKDKDTGYIFTVPEYVNGSQSLQVYLNGAFLVEGHDYLTTGSYGYKSTTVTILISVNKDDTLFAIVYSGVKNEEATKNVHVKRIYVSDETSTRIPEIYVDGNGTGKPKIGWYRIAEVYQGCVYNSYCSMVIDAVGATQSTRQTINLVSGHARTSYTLTHGIITQLTPFTKARIMYTGSSTDDQKIYLEVYKSVEQPVSYQIEEIYNSGWNFIDPVYEPELIENYNEVDCSFKTDRVTRATYADIVDSYSMRTIKIESSTRLSESHTGSVILCYNDIELSLSDVEVNLWYHIVNVGTDTVKLKTMTGVKLNGISDVTVEIRPNCYIQVMCIAENEYEVVHKSLGSKEQTLLVRTTEVNQYVDVPMYTVGNNEIDLYLDGIKTKRNVTFEEVGELGEYSTQLKILAQIPDADIEVVVRM